MRSADESSSVKNNDYFSVKTSTKVIKQHHHNIYMSNHIDQPHHYIDLCHMLRNCNKDDKIDMFINNGGGYIKSTIQIIHAMDECKAKITTHADGHLASCATWLFLAGDDYAISKDIEFMCHYFSGGAIGKGNELEANLDFTKKYYRKKFKKVYKNFLSDLELDELIKGRDFYFGYKEVKRRLAIKKAGK